jgi:hypothetical protein
VRSEIYPGAPLHYILSGTCSDATLRTFRDNDVIAIVGGTNSFDEFSTKRDIEIYITALNLFLNSFTRTKFIISTIPYRNDLPGDSSVNRLIIEANVCIRNWCDKNSIKVLELWDFYRRFYTKHGLHFNKLGKLELTKRLCSCLQVSGGEHPVLVVENDSDSDISKGRFLRTSASSPFDESNNGPTIINLIDLSSNECDGRVLFSDIHHTSENVESQINLN